MGWGGGSPILTGVRVLTLGGSNTDWYIYLTSSDGRAVLVNLHQKVVLFHFNFKQRVYDIKYSPNGRSVYTVGEWGRKSGGRVDHVLSSDIMLFAT